MPCSPRCLGSLLPDNFPSLDNELDQLELLALLVLCEDFGEAPAYEDDQCPMSRRVKG